MLQRPSPLDLRVVDSIIGTASSESEARLVNERLAVLNDWIVDERETRQSIAWREWLKIARPDQLPPQFDPDWREWRISGDRGSGKSTAAARWISSQSDDPNLEVFIVCKTRSMIKSSIDKLYHCGEIERFDHSTLRGGFFCGGRIHTALADYVDGVMLGGSRPLIIWMEELIFLPPGINVGKFHSFVKSMLRMPGVRVIWSG